MQTFWPFKPNTVGTVLNALLNDCDGIMQARLRFQWLQIAKWASHTLQQQRNP